MTRQEKIADLNRQLQRLREKRRELYEAIRKVKLAIRAREKKMIVRVPGRKDGGPGGRA